MTRRERRWRDGPNQGCPPRGGGTRLLYLLMHASPSSSRVPIMPDLAFSSYNLQEKSPTEPSRRWCFGSSARVPPIPREAQMSSKQYREFARECLRWADESASEEDRRHFIC